jgi:hypothetical protein
MIFHSSAGLHNTVKGVSVINVLSAATDVSEGISRHCSSLLKRRRRQQVFTDRQQSRAYSKVLYRDNVNIFVLHLHSNMWQRVHEVYKHILIMNHQCMVTDYLKSL